MAAPPEDGAYTSFWYRLGESRTAAIVGLAQFTFHSPDWNDPEGLRILGGLLAESFGRKKIALDNELGAIQTHRMKVGVIAGRVIVDGSFEYCAD